MKNDKIIIANLKQGDCETIIKKALLKIDGILSVKIDYVNDSVNVIYDDNIDKEKITNKLLSIGFPEATTENGLLYQLKSYLSCVQDKNNNPHEK